MGISSNRILFKHKNYLNNYDNNDKSKDFMLYMTNYVLDILTSEEKKIVFNILTESDLHDFSIANHYDIDDIYKSFNVIVLKITDLIKSNLTKLLDDFTHNTKYNKITLYNYEDRCIYDIIKQILEVA